MPDIASPSESTPASQLAAPRPVSAAPSPSDPRYAAAAIGPAASLTHTESSGSSGSADLQRWDSHLLLGTQTEALIQHGPQTYRLRRTGLGKLILTK